MANYRPLALRTLQDGRALRVDAGGSGPSQLYDPSYGVTYGPAGVSNTTQEGFELRAVYGFAARIRDYQDAEWGADWHFRLPIPGQPDISFQCLAAF